jgi:hypothetical protein
MKQMDSFVIRCSAAIIISLLIIAPLAGAAGSDGMGSGQDSQGGQGGQDGSDGPGGGGQQMQMKVCEAGQACNGTQLQEMVLERQQLLNAGEEQQISQRNAVRLAVHAINISEGLLGENGTRMVQLANQVNASYRLAVSSEQQIQNRNSIVRFFMGGDSGAADEILQQMEQNQVRIQEMNRIIDACDDCDPQVAAVLQEQVQNLEQEQSRLQQLAQDEKEYRGLFGWFSG